MMFVRLKPFDARRRHVKRQYTYGPERKKFEEKRGWYKVDDKLALYLKKVRQFENDPQSPRAFDVCTLEEARRIDAREKKREHERQSADDADGGNDMTTSAVQRRFGPDEAQDLRATKLEKALRPKSQLERVFDVPDSKGPGSDEDDEEEDDETGPELPTDWDKVGDDDEEEIAAAPKAARAPDVARPKKKLKKRERSVHAVQE